MNDRLERRPRGGLAQRFLEQRGGTIDALELGEEDQHLGAHRADFLLGQQVACDRPGARPLAGGLMRNRGRERSTMPLGPGVERRQPQRLLGQLGRDGRDAAVGRELGGVVELDCDLGVRRVLRQREMAGAEQRFVDDARQTSVNAPTLVAEVPIQDGREQRVREADHPVLALDHVRGDRGIERIRRNARPCHQRLRHGSRCRGERQRLACRLGEPRDPRSHELLERPGNRERLGRVDVRAENAGELDREKRISAGPLVDAKQGLMREGPVEPVAQEPMERADAERAHSQPLDAVCSERPLELRRLRVVGQAAGEQDENPIHAEASQGKRKRARRRPIEPLDVVDGDQNRLSFTESVQHVPHGDGECAVVDGIFRRLLAEHGDLECAPPRRRQRGQRLLDDVLEEVAQTNVGKVALSLGRSRRENPQACRARVLDARKPERRLPDARLALQHECGRPRVRSVDESVDRSKFLFPADDLQLSPHATIVTGERLGLR